MSAAEREELRTLLHERSFRFGDFVLASGRKSTFYFDGRQVTLSGRGAYLIGRTILDRCRDLDIAAVGGLTLGADPIAAAVATLSGADGEQPIQAFIVRKEVKGHGVGKLIAGPELPTGIRTAIVDDVITSGGSFLTAVDEAAAAGATVVEAIAIFDREEGGREALEARGIPLHALFQRSEFPAPSPT